MAAGWEAAVMAAAMAEVGRVGAMAVVVRVAVTEEEAAMAAG